MSCSQRARAEGLFLSRYGFMVLSTSNKIFDLLLYAALFQFPEILLSALVSLQLSPLSTRLAQ